MKKAYHLYKNVRSKYRDYVFIFKMKMRAYSRKKIIKKIYKEKPLKILSIEETIDAIKGGKSIARFGDGEFDSILMKDNSFEKSNKQLSEHLHNILVSKSERCLIAISIFLQDMSGKNAFARGSWSDYIIKKRDSILSLITDDVRNTYIFGDASCTRLYFDLKHRNKNAKKYFSLLKTIWKQKKVVIIEGEKTRFGCGNDLLIGSKSVSRILCPTRDSYRFYDTILRCVVEKVDKESLLLIALGPTATCLAFDLCELGYHAFDIGHADIEYEWYIRKAKRKVSISNKYTNEARHGLNPVEYVNDDYLSSIIARVG